MFAFKLCLLQFNFSLLMCQTFLQIEDLLLLQATFSLQLIRLINSRDKCAVCNFVIKSTDNACTYKHTHMACFYDSAVLHSLTDH